jgi:hypothetical protein
MSFNVLNANVAAPEHLMGTTPLTNFKGVNYKACLQLVTDTNFWSELATHQDGCIAQLLLYYACAGCQLYDSATNAGALPCMVLFLWTDLS